MPKILIKNIGRLVTMQPAKGRKGGLGVIAKAALLLDGEKISWFGPSKNLPGVKGAKIINAKGAVVMPALIDCHTHIVHAGFRADEFNLRSQGASYQEIAAKGGGIMSTVRATRSATEKELFELALSRLKACLEYGVATVEIKTGYGLSVEAENKLVDVINKLARKSPQTICGTSLAAHIVPAEYKNDRAGYLKLVTEKMLPYAAKSSQYLKTLRGTGPLFETNSEGETPSPPLTRRLPTPVSQRGPVPRRVFSACDVFVEENAYTDEEAAIIADAGRTLGLELHLHVDQFGDNGGALLAAKLGALSADHLDYTSKESALAMARKDVVGVVLPGASFFAGKAHYPNARLLLKTGLKLAIATDYNPGTSPSLNLWLAATMAVTQIGLSLEEAIIGITKNAALALGLADRGVIEEGMRADLIFIDAENEYFPLYRYDKNFVGKILIGGE